MTRQTRQTAPDTTNSNLVRCHLQDRHLELFLVPRGIIVCADGAESDVVILGREGWTRSEIDRLIDSRSGSHLRIYSQEMFLAFLATRSDPFDASLNVLEAFKAGHAGLKLVSEGWCNWVSTWVSRDRRNEKPFRMAFRNDIKDGPLAVMGYHVGRTGLATDDRRDILREAFTEAIPIVGPADYMAEWGEPSSSARLKKIAESLAAFCRNQKSRQRPSAESIDDWEQDLEWLEQEYYHGHHSFHWPGTFVS